jgi:hypothetical protein
MDFIDKWFYIIRNCSFDNTYKMAWAKAITEISLEVEYSSNPKDFIEITLKGISEKVIRYYWEQTIFFDLQQSSNPNKPPVVVSLVKEIIKVYQGTSGQYQPVKWHRAGVEVVCEDAYRNAIKLIVKALKADVSYRFLRVGGKEIQGVYRYKQNDDALYIATEDLKKLRENSMIVFDVINYRWSQMLENFNHSPKICKKVKIIDEENIRRKSLGRFALYLEVENSNHICFLCNTRIENENPAIDHVIPWSYLYSDDMWNLVYAHQSCNSRKSNIIPSEEMIQKLENRNRILCQMLIKNGKADKHTSELEMAIGNNLVRKFWISCQG